MIQWRALNFPSGLMCMRWWRLGRPSLKAPASISTCVGLGCMRWWAGPRPSLKPQYTFVNPWDSCTQGVGGCGAGPRPTLTAPTTISMRVCGTRVREAVEAGVRVRTAPVVESANRQIHVFPWDSRAVEAGGAGRHSSLKEPA